MRNWIKFVSIFFLFWLTSTQAVDIFNVNNTPLPANEAYQFTASRQGNVITAHWDMAPGYYLYQDRFCFIVDDKHIHNINLPMAIAHQDEILGKYSVYSNQLSLQIPANTADKNKPLTLKVCYQGCTENHFCYPPMMQEVILPPEQTTPVAGTPITVAEADLPLNKANSSSLADKLASQHLGLNLLLFFGFGILLAFTPCILPMLPILTGLIVGHQNITAGKAFRISLTYVLAMAGTYAILGLIAGLAGNSIQAALQTPWAIATTSLLFILLALSLFGFYEIRLPSRLQDRLTQISNHQQSGHYIGALIMGCLATLIVSPCVTPPLIGAIAYIAQTGKSIEGALLLFALGMGAGLPLILVGTFGGHILPRAGNWMITVKNIFGVLMLAVAILLLDRILPGRITLFLWGALSIILSVYLGIFQKAITGWQKFWKGIGLILIVWGCILLVGAAQGSTSPLQPLAGWKTSKVATPALHFSTITTVTELSNELAIAKAKHQPVMLDFYADWCISCKEMDYRTFRNPEVIAALQSYYLIRINITDSHAGDVEILKKQFNIIAPPVLIFLDENGQEIAGTQIVGDIKPKAFLTHLQKNGLMPVL